MMVAAGLTVFATVKFKILMVTEMVLLPTFLMSSGKALQAAQSSVSLVMLIPSSTSNPFRGVILLTDYLAETVMTSSALKAAMTSLTVAMVSTN